jgi:hypothetical protein
LDGGAGEKGPDIRGRVSQRQEEDKPGNARDQIGGEKQAEAVPAVSAGQVETAPEGIDRAAALECRRLGDDRSDRDQEDAGKAEGERPQPDGDAADARRDRDHRQPPQALAERGTESRSAAIADEIS